MTHTKVIILIYLSTAVSHDPGSIYWVIKTDVLQLFAINSSIYSIRLQQFDL